MSLWPLQEREAPRQQASRPDISSTAQPGGASGFKHHKLQPFIFCRTPSPSDPLFPVAAGWMPPRVPSLAC